MTKKLPVCNKIRKIVTTLTRARYLKLYWTTWLYTTPACPISIRLPLILSSYLQSYIGLHTSTVYIYIYIYIYSYIILFTQAISPTFLTLLHQTQKQKVRKNTLASLSSWKFSHCSRFLSIFFPKYRSMCIYRCRILLKLYRHNC
jgi:hypothetical protein